MALALFSCTPTVLQDAENLQAIDIAKVRNLIDSLVVMPVSQIKDRVVIIEQLVQKMNEAGKANLIPPFLGIYLERVPADPFNAYYAFLVAESYRSRDQASLAVIWYHRSLNTSADIISQGESVHYQSLRQLLAMDLPPLEKIVLYNQMLDRFPDKNDPGNTYYHLARAYEEAGLYPQAFTAYTKFLDYPNTIISGKLDEQQRVREMIALYGVNRDWTRESLNQLLTEIRSALATKDYEKLLSLQAKVNFFSMSWLQEKADFNSQVAYDLRRFVQGAEHIYSENNLEGNSNSQEAYLKTWGWSPYMPIWYLYFRRINYPADPEINGNWEWVGIYFGDSLQ